MLCTSNPATEGPLSWVVACVPLIRLFRACSSDLGTTDGRNVEFATKRKTFANDTTSATPISCARVSLPHHQANGTLMMAAARIRSRPTCRRRNASHRTIAPAGNPMTSQAMSPAAVSTPISTALACRISTATSGIATVVTALPTPEVVD